MRTIKIRIFGIWWSCSCNWGEVYMLLLLVEFTRIYVEWPWYSRWYRVGCAWRMAEEHYYSLRVWLKTWGLVGQIWQSLQSDQYHPMRLYYYLEW